MVRGFGVGPLRRLLLPAFLLPAVLAGPVQDAAAEHSPTVGRVQALEVTALVVEPPPPPLGAGAAHLFTVRGTDEYGADVDVAGKVRLEITDGTCDGLTCTPNEP